MKWKWFDLCLYKAIFKLSTNEYGKFRVFSGIGGVKLNTKFVDNGYFVTYTSTSWRKDVALTFVNGEGMLIEIDPNYKQRSWGSWRDVKCCDVSWISKFPDECEILFARSTSFGYDNFKCEVIDESSGVQSVILTKK